MEWSLVLLILMGYSSYLLKAQLYNYIFINQYKTWSEAQEYCRKSHTDLATLYDMEDIKSLCDPTCKEGWIGLRGNESVNRTWHWSLPGVEFDKNETNWGEDEPDDRTKHNQARIEEDAVGINDESKWFDIKHEDTRFFICYNETKSPKYVEIEEEKTWLDAQKYCRENHTDLISGRDQIDGITISSLNGNSWIIGLFRDRFSWSDGNKSSFRNWNEIPRPKHCATIQPHGRWRGKPCEEKKPFYCYNAKVVLIKKKKSWDEAIYYCRKNHHDLVYITNEKEQRWVGQIAREANTLFIWMGLHYTCTLQFWFWVTDKAVTYNNWASNSTNNDCNMSGAMEKEGSNKWYKKLDDEEYNFICSKKGRNRPS